jgi:hypothetical protein
LKKHLLSFLLMVLALWHISPALVSASADKSLHYQVTGKARVWEATVHYRVKEGKKVIAKGVTTATVGAPEWGDFSFDFTVSKAKNKKRTLELYEESMEDGSDLHKLVIPLDKLEGHVYSNEAFADVTGTVSP